MKKYSKKLGKEEAHMRAKALTEVIKNVLNDLNSGKIKVND